MTILITGASKGLGKAIAEKFAAHQYNLIICARSGVQLYHTMEDLQREFPEVAVKARVVDLAEKEGVKGFANWAIAEAKKMPGGDIDVLVNNAGQFVPGSVFNEEEGVLEQMINVNVYSAYHLTRLILPDMMAKKKGHIFNMCSVASLRAYSNGGAYSISKFALLGFSKNLREEMKPHGVKVTSVIPGATYTDSWSESGIPPARMMEAGDIAEMIFATSQLSAGAVVEDLVIRPLLGDV